jgi:hypothetical protein
LPPDVIPAAIGMQLRTILKSKPEKSDVIEPVIRKLEGTKTKVGSALSVGKEK